MKEAIRNFIIKKAREIFEQKGFGNTKIEDIANAANISKPTIYNYFSGKDDIFCAVVYSANFELNKLIQPILEDSASFSEKLRILIIRLLSHINNNRGILKIVFYELKLFVEAIDKEDLGGIKKFLEIKEKRMKMFDDFFMQACKDGYINKDIPVRYITLFFMGVLGEYSMWHVFKKQEFDNKDIRDLSDVIFNILKNGMFKIEL